jgi:hypothetical protein
LAELRLQSPTRRVNSYTMAWLPTINVKHVMLHTSAAEPMWHDLLLACSICQCESACWPVGNLFACASGPKAALDMASVVIVWCVGKGGRGGIPRRSLEPALESFVSEWWRIEARCRPPACFSIVVALFRRIGALALAVSSVSANCSASVTAGIGVVKRPHIAIFFCPAHGSSCKPTCYAHVQHSSCWPTILAPRSDAACSHLHGHHNDSS